MSKQIGGRWYIRRDGKVSGPFAAGLISRHILIGRLRPQDEVSNDQETWKPIARVPELIPEVMKGDQDDPFVHERLLAAQRWADERLQTEPRLREDASGNTRPGRAGDRRDGELDEILEHRGILRQRKFGINSENTFLGWLLLLLILGGIGWGGYYAYENRPEEVVIDCQARPMPNANWQNCVLQGSSLNAVDLSGAILRNTDLTGAQMQSAMLANANADFANMSLGKLANADFSQTSMLGANLRGADLRNTNLQNANLSFANLTGANLDGANLQGTVLHKAIWTDGITCAEGSVTVCSKP
jgi:hypothetical protein